MFGMSFWGSVGGQFWGLVWMVNRESVGDRSGGFVRLASFTNSISVPLALKQPHKLTLKTDPTRPIQGLNFMIPNQSIRDNTLIS